MRRLLVGLALLAFASLARASDRPEAPSRAAADCTGAPTQPETIVAPAATPAGPGLADGATPEARVEERIVPAPAPSKVDRLVHRVDAQLLEKYLAFRESLTSP